MINKSISSFQDIDCLDQSIESSSNCYSESIGFSELNEPVCSDISTTVSYRDSVIEINTNCSKINQDSYSYKRHYLMIHLKEEKSENIQKIISCYFQNMEVGDMIKIVPIGKDTVKNVSSLRWLQKRKNQKINNYSDYQTQLLDIVNQNQMLIVINNVMKQSQKYNNFVQISLFVDYSFSEQIKKNLKQKLKSSVFKNSYQIFCLTEQIMSQIPKSQQDLKIHYLSKNLPKQIELFLQDFKNIRLKDLTISIQCINGSLIRKSIESSDWIEYQNKLIKTITSLKCHSFYSQNLKIINSSSSINIIIQVKVTRMNGDINEFQGYFTILNSQRQLPKTINCVKKVVKSDSIEILSIKNKLCKDPGTVLFTKTKNLAGQV